MGATPWGYFTPYREDISSAFKAMRRDVLGDLGEQRFRELLESANDPADVELKMTQIGEDTVAVLNMMSVSEIPGMCCIAPLTRSKLLELYGTDKPTHDQVEKNGEIFCMERGEGVYVVVYAGNQPAEVYFAGYTFD